MRLEGKWTRISTRSIRFGWGYEGKGKATGTRREAVKRLMMLVVLGVVFVAPAPAQWSAGFQLGTLLDDNAFNNYLQIQDRLTELTLQGTYDWDAEASNTQAFYTGSLNYFALLPSRTFQLHSAGLTYSHLFGEEGEATLNTGATFSLRDNHEEYSIYDHYQMSLYGNLHGFLSDNVSMKGGYLFRSVAFAELEGFNYTEHYAFAQGALTLPTRTMIIVQADLGFKHYTTPNADSSSLSSGGFGKGKRTSEIAAPGVTQLIGTVRIGQGITEVTGLSLTGQYQVSLQKESRYLTFSDGILTDDELFDDHYGYDGPLGSLMVTQMFPADIRIRASGQLQRRLYSDRSAFDLSGVQVSSQRIDTRSVFSVSADKAFPSMGISLTLTFDHIVNASNDAFYSYRNSALSARLSFAY